MDLDSYIMGMASTFDISKARHAFPALRATHQTYFDNAGGSQVLGKVSSTIKNYLEETNVQLGATYGVAQQSTDIFNDGMKAAAAFINADLDDVVIGPSTTQLFTNLSLALSLPPQSELILSQVDHEANISPWVRLAKLRGYQIKWWTPTTGQGEHAIDNLASNSLMLTPDNLRPLLSEKTKLVCCTHTSNVLGGIHDIAAISTEVHTIPGARLCVDGVALAPHRGINVQELGVDFYSFSWYKVYGPHIAILYASSVARASLETLSHYFHSGDTLSTKLGLAAASYELVAAIPSIVAYFGHDRNAAWEDIANHEEKLQELLLSYLRGRDNVVIHGYKEADKAKRVPVISFTIKGKNSRDVVENIESRSAFGCRWGHFYSKRLVDEYLGLGAEGVVRVSLVHYNTEEEVRDFVKVLDAVLQE